MEVASGHPDAACPRLAAYARVFEAWGAKVRVFEGADNCLRVTASGAWVEVEGTANLVHEIAHALVAGRIADDHGFDYGAIPIDLGRPSGRAVLWDELSACTTSCAFSRRPPEAWFREQFEIQPVFYGYDDVSSFARAVDEAIASHGDELRAFERRVRARFDAALRRVGAPPWIRRPVWSVSLDGLWSRTLDALSP